MTRALGALGSRSPVGLLGHRVRIWFSSLGFPQSKGLDCTFALESQILKK